MRRYSARCDFGDTTKNIVNLRRHSTGTAVALLLVFSFLPATTRADWAVTALDHQLGGKGAIEYRHYSLGETSSGSAAELQLTLFSNQKATLRVIDQPNFDRRLAAAMTQENCLAGVNGGYFDPEGAPVGLLMSDGKIIAPFRRARLLSGVLSARPGRVEIFRASEFPNQRKSWRDAVPRTPSRAATRRRRR